jgi:hypothetical protein
VDCRRRRGGRAAEGGGLLNRYTVQQLYRGFESPSLRRQVPVSAHFSHISANSRANARTLRGAVLRASDFGAEGGDRGAFSFVAGLPVRFAHHGVGNASARNGRQRRRRHGNPPGKRGQGGLYWKPRIARWSHQASGWRCRIRRSAVRSDGCRPSRIASMMSGLRKVRSSRRRMER